MSDPVELLNALGHDNPTPTYEPVGDDRAPAGLITISLPGAVDQILKDSDYPKGDPSRWRRYRARRTTRRIGDEGFAAIVRLDRPDWVDVLGYLVTRKGRGKTEIKALRVAVKRIGDALGESRG